MLDRVREYRARCDEFCVPVDHLNNADLIQQRVEHAPPKVRSALRLVLSYLYLVEGPTNLRTPQYREAEPYLMPYEVILSRYLKSRTNGAGRKAYGKPALRHVRTVGYRCECCGCNDVRVLNLDHVHGRGKPIFFLLCANCHNLKSRLFDWLGEKRTAAVDPIIDFAPKSAQ
jgi:hypothetical protein